MKTQDEKITKGFKGFKGFNKDLECMNFQYEIGKEYKTDRKPIRCTENGFHFCENPIDVFRYYSPNESRYAAVEGFGDVSTDEEDSKVAVSEIKIGAELSLHSLIESGIKFIFERTTLTKESTNREQKKQASNSGYRGAASNSGDKGAASNSGYRGAASNSGDKGAASNSGDSGAASNSGDSGAASNSGDSGAASNSGYRGAASNSGDSGAASNSGYRGAASNSGDKGAASNSGDSGAASNSGYRGAASNSGDSGAASNSGYSGAASNSGDKGAAFSIGSYSSAETTHEDSFACALGYNNKARGVLNSWITLAEYDDNYKPICVKSAKIDGKKLKSDIWYILKNKKFKEA